MASSSGSRTRSSHGHGHSHAHHTHHHSHSAALHRTKCAKCCHYFKVVITFLFSHIGLVTLLLAYSVMGAFVFQALESENEIKQRSRMNQAQEELVSKLWEITENPKPDDVLVESKWSVNASAALREFEVALLEAVRKHGYDGKHN